MTPEYGRCERKGCGRRKVDPAHRGCNAFCGSLARLVAEAQSLAEIIGPNEWTDRMLIATEEMNKQYDKALTARRAIKKNALAVGITDNDFSQMLRGNYPIGSQPGQHTGDN
jgi:hypothetical protein